MFWISRIHILFFISVCFFCIVLSCADEEHAQVNDSSSSFLLTPDLVLSDLKVPDRGTIGDQITGSVVITNKGPVSASHIFMDVMLVEEEDNNNTIWLVTKGTDMMEAGTRGMIPFSFSVPAGIHEGNYSVLLNVVAYESELFPSDNTICSQKPISLKKKTSGPGETTRSVSCDPITEYKQIHQPAPRWVLFILLGTLMKIQREPSDPICTRSRS
jgi:hypothetical protein